MDSDARTDELLRSTYPDSVPVADPSDLLEAELAEMVPKDPRKPLRQIGILLIASLAYAAVMVVWLGFRPDFNELPTAWLFLYVAAWVFGFSGIAALAMLPRKDSSLPRARIGAGISLGVMVLFVSVGLLFPESAPSSFEHPNTAEHTIRFGKSCLSLGLATAVVPVFLCIFFLRRSLPYGSRGIATAIGATGGCLGGLMLHLHCQVSSATHLGFVHGGVVVVAALLTWLLTPKLLQL